MEYYFASWDDDAHDIFALMEDWWEDTGLQGDIELDEQQWNALHHSGHLLTICARDEKGILVACFTGVVNDDLFRKGKKELKQIAACFHPSVRTAHAFLAMLKKLESLCIKLKIDSVMVNVLSPRIAKVLEKRNYSMENIYMYKEPK